MCCDAPDDSALLNDLRGRAAALVARIEADAADLRQPSKLDPQQAQAGQDALKRALAAAQQVLATLEQLPPGEPGHTAMGRNGDKP
jgi:hypothetical protein